MIVSEAFVSIRPDLTKFSAELQKGVGPLGDKMGRDLSEGVGKGAELGAGRMTTAFKAGAAGAALAIGSIGTAMIGVSGDVKEAQNTFQTQLGISADKASELGDVAKTVFGDNFASSVTDAASTISTAFQQMGDVGQEELASIAENAFRLKDAFGFETTASIDAAKTLMEQFGVSSQEAFDLIAAGQQKGLNRSGDFLDSIGEYATQFASGGASAEEFFSILQSGMQGGVLGTDKAADAFKEFRVRIQDGSKTTAEGLKLLGINMDDFAGALGRGEMTGAQAFETILQKLRETDDSTVRMQAGVALLGTQFEDLGVEGALALTTQSDAFANTEGAAASLDAQYNTLGSSLEGYKRKALLALEPVTGVIAGSLPVVGQLGMALTGLGPIASGLGPKLGIATAGLRAMGMAMLTPPLGIIIALVALGLAVYVFRDEIIDAFGAAAAFVVPKIMWVKDQVVGGFNKILDFARDNWPEIASLISGPFFPLVALATDAFGIRSALEDAFNSILDFIGGLAGSAFEKAKAFGEGIYDGIKWGVNQAITAINYVIRAWNDFSISTPAVKVLGETIIPGVDFETPDIGEIPHLATGMPFVPADMLAFLHRGERIVPASENRPRRQDEEQAQRGFVFNNYGPITVNDDKSRDLEDIAFSTAALYRQELRSRGYLA